MADCYQFKEQDSVKLNNRTVFIVEQIKCTQNKGVYKVIFDLQNRKQHILKTIYGEDEEALNTINFYMRDHHNYFMEMIDFYKDDTKTFLLLKYYEEKTIYEYVDNHELTPQQQDRFIANILEIGCYLHKNSYLHADIKPDNFFIDSDRVRLGDLESTVKLNNIHQDTIENLAGTSGFKYSTNHTYTLQDEIFAYIATIYFIEVGEVLINKKEFKELTEEENPFDAINQFAKESIENNISRENIINFLLDTLDAIEDNHEIDCCTMLEQFELLPKDIGDDFIDNGGDIPIKKEEIKTKKWKKPLLLTLGSIILISLTTLFITQPTTPTCQKAIFIDDQTIRVEQKNGNIDFYNYSANNGFIPIYGEEILDVEDKERFFSNSKGVRVECRDGRVKVF
jgi:serine/threonine protein kinase